MPKLSNPQRGPKRKHRLYLTWKMMRNRCNNPNGNDWNRYGGRGIKVCERWNDFWTFVDDVWPSFKEGLSLGRIDNDKGYFPENCEWQTWHEQGLNTKRNRLVTIRGETHPLDVWVRMCGLPYATVRDRIVTLNWDPEKAITAPVVFGQKLHPMGSRPDKPGRPKKRVSKITVTV